MVDEARMVVYGRTRRVFKSHTLDRVDGGRLRENGTGVHGEGRHKRYRGFVFLSPSGHVWDIRISRGL